MSIRSLISLPPKLEMTPRSIQIGQMKQQLSSIQSTNTSTEIVSDNTTDEPNSRCEIKTEVSDESVKEKPMIGLPIAFDTSRLVQLTENTFPLSSDQPLNIKIMLHAAARQQMTSTRTRKVTFSREIEIVYVEVLVNMISVTYYVYYVHVILVCEAIFNM